MGTYPCPQGLEHHIKWRHLPKYTGYMPKCNRCFYKSYLSGTYLISNENTLYANSNDFQGPRRPGRTFTGALIHVMHSEVLTGNLIKTGVILVQASIILIIFLGNDCVKNSIIPESDHCIIT